MIRLNNNNEINDEFNLLGLRRFFQLTTLQIGFSIPTFHDSFRLVFCVILVVFSSKDSGYWTQSINLEAP